MELGKCASLVHVYLCSNGIRDRGAEALGAGLGQCPSLAYLDLRATLIEQEAGEKLAAVLGPRVTVDVFKQPTVWR